jgi:spore germination protein (amino acid permease)
LGHDGWISLLLCGIITILAGILLLLLMKRYRDKSIYDVNKLLFGKTLGSLFNIVIIAYLLFAAAIGIRIFGGFVNLTLLTRTPPLVLSAFIIIPTIYASWYGLKIISRFMSINFFILTVVIIFYFLVSREARFTFLQPVGESGLPSILTSLKGAFFAFIGFELVTIIYPNIKDKENAMKFHILASFISMLFFTLTVVILTAIFGEHMLQRMSTPLFNLTRIYNAPILERVDLYFIALWLIVMANSIRAYFFSAYYSLSQLLAVKDRKPLYVVYVLVVIFISRLPKDMNDVNKYTDFLNLMGMGIVSFIILCLPLSYIRTKGVVKNESSK